MWYLADVAVVSGDATDVPPQMLTEHGANTEGIDLSWMNVT